MQRKFRHTTMPHVCNIALSHIRKAKQYFAAYGLSENTSHFFVIINYTELSLQPSLDQRVKAEAFMRQARQLF